MVGAAHRRGAVRAAAGCAAWDAGQQPQYDPEVRSLAAREKAKAAELAAAGRPVAASTVKHRRQRYEAAGPGRAG